MDWNLIITLLVGIVTILGFVYGFLRNFKTDINKHIDRIDQNMIAQGKRTDHLYEICVELLRNRK